MNATPESLIKDYADPIEQQEIDKFVCSEMGRQIHRYIKGMSGTKQAMLKFEERLASLSVPEKEKAIAKYIDLIVITIIVASLYGFARKRIRTILIW